jgi:hypothetical protein
MYNLVSINRDDHKENGFPAFVRNTSHIRSDMGSSDCVLAGFCQLQGNLVRLQGQPGLLQIENNNDGCFDWSCLFLITLFGCYFSLSQKILHVFGSTLLVLELILIISVWNG